MHKVTGILSLMLSFVLMFAVGICSSQSPASRDSANKTTTTKTSTNIAKKSSATTHKSTAKTPAKSTTKTPAKETSHNLASAEDLSGTITTVDHSGREITLMGSNGVPYDFDLTPRTRVEVSNEPVATKELASESHKQATIHFVPTSRGNMAQSIQITAS
jgi:HD superfamily phosphohydrolase